MCVESPLTAIDFTPDGAGLVVGSTQGRLYLYDLRNLSAPTKTATAHKTSITSLRFQSSQSRHLKVGYTPQRTYQLFPVTRFEKFKINSNLYNP